jgi:hypothetical protein
VTHLSPSEEAILRLIPRDGRRVTTKDLVRRRYRGCPDEEPSNSQVVVSGVVRSLVKKAKGNRSLPRLRSSRRMGPRPIEVWIEP